MTRDGADDLFEQIVARLAPQSKLLRTWPLTGGVSAQVTALELAQPDGQTRKLIVRQHGEQDRQQNPNIAADEFRLLEILSAAGIAAPTPCYLDQSGQILTTPYLVVEYVAGEMDFAPGDLNDYLLQAATHLAKIHQVDRTRWDLTFLPDHATSLRKLPGQLAATPVGAQVHSILTANWPPRLNSPTLLHGDFWPGNLIWHANQLAAVIDWEDAQIGDPLADLANSRLEFLWAFGRAAQQQFTHHYQSMAQIDLTNLPYHDLYAAGRNLSKIAAWGLDAATEQTMHDQLNAFIAQAIAELSTHDTAGYANRGEE